MAITSFYDLLEVSTNASKEQIEASYPLRQQKFLKTYGDEPVKLALVLSLLKDAYETLIDPVKRLEHDKALDAQMAQTIEKQSHAKDTNSKVTSCYYLLGVDRGNATRDQIDNSYRVSEENLRRAFGGEPVKLERALKVIAYAYETLTDPVRKLEHDRVLDAQVAAILEENRKKTNAQDSMQSAHAATQEAAQAATQAATEAALRAAKVAANAAEQLSRAQDKAAHDAVKKFKQDLDRNRQRNIGVVIFMLVIGAFVYTYLDHGKNKEPNSVAAVKPKESVQKKQVVTSQPKNEVAKTVKPIANKQLEKNQSEELAASKAAEIERKNADAKRVCDNAYGQDAMLEEQIKQINDTYGNLLDRLSNQRLSASLAGAGGRSWSWAQGMQQAAAPYDNKINEVILERDNKLNKVRYEQKKLRFEFRQCYP